MHVSKDSQMSSPQQSPSLCARKIPAILIASLVSIQVCAAASDPVFPYGAVYFRKSNPPEADWDKDHKTASEAGMNMFRHWVMWSAVEVAPGRYDWRDYDRMMDLEGQNGIKAVLAEQITAAPERGVAVFSKPQLHAQVGHRRVPEH